jgi:hypothetical protein
MECQYLNRFYSNQEGVDELVSLRRGTSDVLLNKIRTIRYNKMQGLSLLSDETCFQGDSAPQTSIVS